MHRILIFLVFTISLFSFKTAGTHKEFHLDKVDSFDVDILGNLYIVQANELTKYNNKLEKQASFTNLSLGDISSIDASDAMNLLVFYEDFAKLLFLDNTLSLKKDVIDLSDLGFANVSLACLSYNNAFWIFDPVNQELVRINQFLEITERSGNLNQIIQTELEPDQLFESGNNVYLKDRNEGVFIFDRYAGFIKRMPFLKVDDVQIKSNVVLCLLRNDTVLHYNMETLMLDTSLTAYKSIKQMREVPNAKSSDVYYLKKDGSFFK